MRAQQEGGHVQPMQRALIDTKPAGTLILDIPASRTLRNKSLLLEPPCLWEIKITPRPTTRIPYSLHGETHEVPQNPG